MLTKILQLVGGEAFSFIKKTIPGLFDLPSNYAFALPLFHLLLYAFDSENLDSGNLGKIILQDKNAEAKLVIIYEGVSKILRELHAENDGKESLVTTNN
jgi:hypothetical protein